MNILWHCLSLVLEWKRTFFSPVCEFSKFSGILSATLLQHHLLGFEIAQLEFHYRHYLCWHWCFLRPTWLHTPGCLVLGEWSHHCGYPSLSIIHYLFNGAGKINICQFFSLFPVLLFVIIFHVVKNILIAKSLYELLIISWFYYNLLRQKDQGSIILLNILQA